MLAPDLKPNRLARAKLEIEDFVKKLKGVRLGLIPFAGDAFLWCPLTYDTEAFLDTLHGVDTAIIPTGGTNLLSALETAEISFKGDESAAKIMILITDGEDLKGQVESKLPEFARKGWIVHTIGIGTEEGELIPITKPDGSTTYVTDAEGNVVKSKLDAATLEFIAENTGGTYHPLGTTGQGLYDLFENVIRSQLLAREESRLRKIPIERYAWVVFAIIAILTLELLIKDRKKKPKSRKPIKAAASVKATMLLLALLPTLKPSSLEASTAREAQNAYLTGDFESAESLYQAASAKKPENLETQYNLGVSAMQNGNYSAAKQAFDLTLNSTDLELQEPAYYNRGTVNYFLGRQLLDSNPQETIKYWEQAIKDYQNALALDPEDQNANDNKTEVERLLEELKKLLENQNQDNQDNQDQQNQDQQNQDQQNQDQQNQDQQNQDQQNQDQQNQDQQNQDQQNQDQQNQDQQNQDQQNQDQQNQDQQNQDQQNQDQQNQDQQNQDQQNQDRQNQDQQNQDQQKQDQQNQDQQNQDRQNQDRQNQDQQNQDQQNQDQQNQDQQNQDQQQSGEDQQEEQEQEKEQDQQGEPKEQPQPQPQQAQPQQAGADPEKEAEQLEALRLLNHSKMKMEMARNSFSNCRILNLKRILLSKTGNAMTHIFNIPMSQLIRTKGIATFCSPLLLVIGLLSALLPISIHATEIKASLGSSTIPLGGYTYLSITVEGSTRAQVELPNVDGLILRDSGTSQNTSIINGHITKSAVVRITILGDKEGTFTIPSFPVMVEKETHHTEPVTVQVTNTPQSANSNAEQQGNQATENLTAEDIRKIARIELKVDPTTVYIGQKVPISVELWVNTAHRFDNLSAPLIQNDHILMDSLGQDYQRTIEYSDDERYEVYTWNASFTPLKDGSIDLMAETEVTVSRSCPQENKCI